MNSIFDDLRSKNEEVRNHAADELREYVASQSRELSGEQLTRFNNEINRRIFELIHSNDNSDRLGGIIAIDKLIDYEGEENTTKITRFANYLRLALPGNDTQTMMLAAKALGRLALPGGALTAEFVEFEVRRALEWLQGDRHGNRRLAAVLVLQELAVNSPTLIYSYISQILDSLWPALRDSKVQIRDSAAECLSTCLEIIYQRESSLRTQYYVKTLEEAQTGLKIGTPEAIHGSLLVYGELLLKAGMFMHERYSDVCNVVLRYKSHKDYLVRRSVVLLIPTLAAYNPSEFTKSYLHESMTHLLQLLKKERERGSAFISIGQVSTAVGSAMGPYLDSIMVAIRENLSTKGRNRNTSDSEVFQCISMLARANGQSLTKYMQQDILDLMFACGLSSDLRQALADIGHYIPPLLNPVQDRLINMLSLILSGKPFQPPGSPANSRNGINAVTKDLSAMTMGPKDSELVVLALKTLGSFDFSGHALSEFVRDCAISYLEDDSAEVRKAAALTCCQLFVRDPICYQTSNYAVQVVGEVLEKLLTIGIADPDPTIRYIVLSSLDERFDRHLAQADNIRSLFIALNDEVFVIREVAIMTIGRLTVHNPAYVMPSLRKTLIQLLTELEYSGISRNKEESAKLLSLLVRAARKLIKPYVEPMLKVLLPKCHDPSPGVASSVLGALGELAEVGGEDLRPYIQQFMPLIIETLQDQSSPMKREAALRTLGQLCRNAGYVIDPYIDHPALLNILVSILKTEQAPALRRETVKAVGILGALDPYRFQILEDRDEDHIQEQKAISPDVSLLMAGMGPSSEDYFPTVVITTLMNILRDPSLGIHHTAVIQAVMYIFKTLGLKCVPFLGQIVPGFFTVMRNAPPNILEFYFQQLGILVTIVKQHIRNFLPEIFVLIKDFWNPKLGLQITILSLVESIAIALDGEFKIHLPALLPLMLQIFDLDESPNRAAAQKVLNTFIVFGANIEEYMHLILPVIVKMFERNDSPLALRKTAIKTVAQLSRRVDISDHASRIIHPLARILNNPNVELRMTAMDTLCAMIFQLGYDYAIFIPMINKYILANRIQHHNYDVLVSKLLRGESLPQDLNPDERIENVTLEAMAKSETGAKKLPVNQQHLKNAWEASQRSTREDWLDWIRRLSVELLKESPSHALRACAGLAGVYYPLARELFNAGFVSCWTELYEQYQDELVRSIETALTSPNIPPEILQVLLNLAEFMEHDDKALPIDIRTLGAYAAKCHAFAKALHYKELEFINEPSTDTIEALISINNQLQQPDAAIGILGYAQAHHKLELKATWYEKLQQWEDALAAYERRSELEPESFSDTMGKMRCLHALGEWDLLSQLAQVKWTHASQDARRSIAPLAAAAAWGLGKWELMDDYISVMRAESPDRAFFRAIISLHSNNFKDAEHQITKARDLLDTELTALVGESYNRAYSVTVRVQMLAELDEIIQYKEAADNPAKQKSIRDTWMKRLKGCQRNVEVWQRMLKVRALVISPKENMEMWIKFANLCSKSGRLGLAEKSLNSLLDEDESVHDISSTTNTSPRVVYAHLKFMWTLGEKQEALRHLRELTSKLATDIGLDINDKSAQFTIANPSQATDQSNLENYTKLLARCYHKQGEWQAALAPESTPEKGAPILNDFYLATQFDRDWYKAWHSWALANFQAVPRQCPPEEVPNNIIQNHVIPAINGFFRSIAISSGSSLQNTLRLLTLWFNFGSRPEVNYVVNEGFSTVSIDTWLEVIPQLIARIHAPSSLVRRSIHQLLSDVGRAHPQALVYPITVASKSQSASRQRSAFSIMDNMRTHSPHLVEQALLVSQELIRVAILWHEQWHEGLEEASRLYFGDHNIKAMFATLEPLHDMLERGPETLREISFYQAFGRDLQEAREWCTKYKRSGDTVDLNQAWDLYYQVFKKISKQLPQLTTLELQYVSPKLLVATGLEIAVPGSYQSGKPVVRIESFNSTFTVIPSKQRPRRLTIRGSDGKDYSFLLKGHEDIRQDERVMQLFGLVNTLLSVDSECFKRHMSVERFPVIPLSQNSGLIGWVPDSDTLHVLIRDYRESRKILLNIEHRLMLQMAPDYDNLTLLEKIEVFEYSLHNTTGQDLYRVLWLKSRSSEAWLDRRTNYTRSLAVMSMVGYILGLGDRHPSNLMLHRYSGKIIHIDFGDCFEVAMHREKFPEKVPFRLTRMLINAMEVSGLEGSFRITCEHAMRVLRDHKESLMAVLEAFVYDPLVNWRLMSAQPSPPDDRKAEDADAFAAEGGAVNGGDGKQQVHRPEVLNQRAVAVLNRVSNKLTGRDFKPNHELDVSSQVDKLIKQATSVENLCQLYIGWCSFW